LYFKRRKPFTITVFILDPECEWNDLPIGETQHRALAGGEVDGPTYKQRKDLPVLVDLVRV
jgi:hypothetical protein